MIKPDDPQDLELGALYRTAAQEAPSPGLDARILAAARDAATPPREATATLRPKSWMQRWHIPVALAATVLMTLTMTLLVREHDVDGDETMRPQPAAVERKSGAAAPTASAAPAEPASIAPASPAQQMAPRQSIAETERVRSDTSAATERRAKAAAPPREDRGEANTAKDQLADRPTEEPRSPPQSGRAAERITPSVTESTAGAAAMRSAPAAASASASAKSVTRPALSGTLERGPEQWLEEIRQLRREGRATEAEARLAEFRNRYPQFLLPEDLKQP